MFLRPLLLTLLTTTMTLAATPSTTTAPSQEPPALRLWPARAPLATGDAPADTPTLTPYLALTNSSAPKPAVIVCPGGGYVNLMVNHEGADVARWLNAHGISAFVLRYRVAPYRHPAPLLDVHRALRTVRAHARDWNIDPTKVGILGFSAGGHLAAGAATIHDDPPLAPTTTPSTQPTATRDAIDTLPARPDFAILIYPVISMVPPYAHVGSANNLTGPDAPESLRREMSLETRVTPQTSPCFLVHGRPDKIVDYHNSQLFYDALCANNVPAHLELYDTGPHGFGLGQSDPNAKHWPTASLQWLRDLKVLPTTK